LGKNFRGRNYTVNTSNFINPTWNNANLEVYENGILVSTITGVGGNAITVGYGTDITVTYVPTGTVVGFNNYTITGAGIDYDYNRDMGVPLLQGGAEHDEAIVGITQNAIIALDDVYLNIPVNMNFCLVTGSNDIINMTGQTFLAVVTQPVGATVSVNGTGTDDCIDFESANTGTYTFTYEIFNLMGMRDTATVNVTVQDVLPVELTRFEAEYQETFEHIHISFSTATETNNSHFELERSDDGINWKHRLDIESVHHEGNGLTPAHYNFGDKETLNGKNYYRLKQVDLDGQFEYVGGIVVAEHWRAIQIDAFPNPVGAVLSYKVKGIKSNNAKLELLDFTGRVIKVLSLDSQNIDLLQEQAGIYFLRYSDNETFVTKKIVKQ